MKNGNTLMVGVLVGLLAAGWSSSANCQTGGNGNSGKAFSRPEERGEDLSGLSASEAVSRFSVSTDKVERRKLAKTIGDRSIAGTLRLSRAEEKQLQQEVEKTLQLAKSSDANERTEARQQIERLWRAAAPTLIAHVTTNNIAIAELSLKSLILMRDETIVSNLVAEAKSAKDDARKQMLVFGLSQMKEQRESLVPGRECLDVGRSADIYVRLVAPALQELKP
jgi:hypothetical protein